MTDSAISFDELAARLKTAADGELFAINQLELQGARASLLAPELYRLTVAETRRQAAALGLAHQIARVLASKPELAVDLGILPTAQALPGWRGWLMRARRTLVKRFRALGLRTSREVVA